MTLPEKNNALKAASLEVTAADERRAIMEVEGVPEEEIIRVLVQYYRDGELI